MAHAAIVITMCRVSWQGLEVRWDRRLELLCDIGMRPNDASAHYRRVLLYKRRYNTPRYLLVTQSLTIPFDDGAAEEKPAGVAG